MFFLSRHIVYIGWLLAGGIFYSTGVAAQAVDSGYRHTGYMKDRDARITGSNPAGLAYMPMIKISEAQVHAGKVSGGFRNYYESDNSVSWSAEAESFYRLNRRVALRGNMAYENFSGKNMAGSAFIDPYKNPVDLDENADTTAGIKKRERYHLTGAAGINITDKLALGGKLDFEAANYAKTKDLRHVNKLLNMDITAGAMYAISKKLDAGISYNHIRRIESYLFSIHGNTDRQYLSLINFGSFYGRTELFTESAVGYTSSNTGSSKPYVNKTNVLSAQLHIRLLPAVTLFNEFSFGSRDGYLGEKGNNSIVYTAHESSVYRYNGVLAVRKNRAFHRVQLTASYEMLSNYENVFDRVTSPGGVSSVIYHGRNQMLSQDILSAGVDYTGYWQVEGAYPAWVLKAGGDFFNRVQTTVLFPFYREQDIAAYRLHLMANRNIQKHKDLYGVFVQVGYGAGGGTASEEGVYAPPSASQPLPRSRDKYLYEEYEYFTCPRIQAGAAFQYTTKINHLPVFARVGYSITHASNTHYLSSLNQAVHLSVGCIF